MNEVVYYGIRAWLAVREFCGCSRKNQKQSTSTSPPSSSWEFFEEFSVQTLLYSNGSGRIKRVIHPPGHSSAENASTPEVFPPTPPPPWFFIGCYDSAKSLQDKTCEMDEYVYPGNVITLNLLRCLFPGTQRWVYIDPKTFEETDFPSEGIVIEA